MQHCKAADADGPIPTDHSDAWDVDARLEQAMDPLRSLKSDSYRLKDRDLGRVPTTGPADE